MRIRLHYLIPLILLLGLFCSIASQQAMTSDAPKSLTVLVSDDLLGWFEGCG